MTGIFSLAVHALVYLEHRGETVSSETLAENICTNPSRVRKVMALLRDAGLVETHEGRRGGGYRFALDPNRVTLREIGEALDVRFVASAWRSGDPEKPCLIASGMAGVMDALYAQMDEQCHRQLAQITLADVSRQVMRQ